MVDLLLAVLATTVLAALGLAALAGLTVVPFVLSLRQAAAAGRSVSRAGALAAAGVALGLALAGAVLLLDAPVGLAVFAVVVVYTVPAALRVLGSSELLGSAGRHEAR